MNTETHVVSTYDIKTKFAWLPTACTDGRRVWLDRYFSISQTLNDLTVKDVYTSYMPDEVAIAGEDVVIKDVMRAFNVKLSIMDMDIDLLDAVTDAFEIDDIYDITIIDPNISQYLIEHKNMKSILYIQRLKYPDGNNYIACDDYYMTTMSNNRIHKLMESHYLKSEINNMIETMDRRDLMMLALECLFENSN